MIDISKLADADKGREVVFESGAGRSPPRLRRKAINFLKALEGIKKPKKLKKNRVSRSCGRCTLI
jgi:hypothetical protein